MFKFRFSSDLHEINEGENAHESSGRKWKQCEEILYHDNALINHISETFPFDVISGNDSNIKCISSKDVVTFLKETEDCAENSQNVVLKAEQDHSDLLPAIYEGGLKIWECTYDLLQYMAQSKIQMKNQKVLDLGCGAGIIGIRSLIEGAMCWFQDYNTEIIKYITIPNVLLNCKNKTQHCKFYAGDWGSFSDLVQDKLLDENNKFDYIFTSETIYNTETYLKLHKVFQTCLKKNGEIYLSAKSFYFGVGGGITLFKEYLDQHKVFKYSTCWECVEGIKRAVLKIQFTNTL